MGPKLTLGELEALAGTGPTWLLALAHPWIAGEKTVSFQCWAVFLTEFIERTRDGEAEGSSLPLKSSTRGLGFDIVVLDGIDHFKGLQHRVLL